MLGHFIPGSTTCLPRARTSLIWAIAPIVLLALLGRGALAAPTVRPNIILIMTDDQGYGEMSCHGNPILQTPNLDRLHRESVRFTDFHVSPTCAPTRCALMTGRHEFRSGVTHTIYERERMSLKTTTLAQVLQKAGYHTGIFGKWHLGDEDAYQPERRGFDEVFIHGAGGIGQTYPGSGGDAPDNKYFNPAILHNGKFERTEGFCTDVFFSQAIKWMDQQRARDEPWFAYITPNAPHGPYICPEPYKPRFQGQGLSNAAIAYYGMIANIDDNLGRLLDQLRDWDLDRRTLVIFMTDNGHAVAELYNAGMRGAKATPYQGGTRVPSFWRWPGTLPAGSDVTALTAHIDILPTLAEITGATLPASPPLDGRSLVPLLKDVRAPWPDRYLFTHVGRWDKGEAASSKFSQCAVRTPRFRLVNNRELYDILADPGEQHNVIAQHPDAVAAMRKAYDQWWDEILPALENEDVVPVKTNPFKDRYWRQFGGKPRPNILWITSEDHGPHLGCYGDKFATTPNIDALARRSLTYRHVWSNAPVCAPARTALITGMYPPSLGAEHMRSMVPMPHGTRLLPQLLRAAGYYCTNNSKTDYNVQPEGQVWDESSTAAHWKNRATGQPFFAVFNSTKSHESRIRQRPHQAVHDPAQVRVPAYHPDAPEVRQDWAQYYDQVTEVDADAGAHLAELAAAGLADQTIVFYFADHGSGMPRNKRWPLNSGLRVPLIIHIPDAFAHLESAEYQPGGMSGRVLGFVDFAPTVLSLAGIEPPPWMQGRAFLGEYSEPTPRYAFGFRARMDERYDLMRSVTDGRFVYVRNFAPHRIYGQHVSYMFETPTTRVWQEQFAAGKLNASQAAFWQAKPPEELYDTALDPDEVRNLATSGQHQEICQRLRQALDEWERRIRDVGFLPEGDMHRRAGRQSPYDLALRNEQYPFERVYAAARLAARLDPDATTPLRTLLARADADPAERYWAAAGLFMRGAAACGAGAAEIRQALADPSPDVRVVAAEALTRFGQPDDVARSLAALVKLADWRDHDVFTVMAALNALDLVGPVARDVWPQIRRLPDQGPLPHSRYAEYVPRLLDRFK